MSQSSTIERSGSARGACSDEGDSDGVLLNRFLAERDEAAFEALVVRHGPAVWRTCRSRLAEAEAEDAFQATFVALVRRAAQVRDGSSLAAWLGAVARRSAGRLRMQHHRLRATEGTTADLNELPARAGESGVPTDVPPLLRAEVARLPEKYRRVVELCYWQGLSCEQAAGRLDCPPGTIKWRLARAREILRGRLERIGVAVCAVLFVKIPPASASSRVKPRLGRGRPPGESVAGAGELAAELIRRTVDQATTIRGLAAPGAVVVRRIRPQRPRRLRRTWASLAVAGLIVAAAASLLPWRKVFAAIAPGLSWDAESNCHDPGARMRPDRG